MRWITFVLLLASISLGVRQLYVHKAEVTLPLHGRVPQVSLVNSDGSAMDTSKLKGAPWVINFFFTRCKMVCPAVNGRVASLIHKLPSDSNVKFLSVTIDPDHDSLKVLSDYAKRFSADPKKWFFLSGASSALNTLTEDTFHLGHFDDINFHSTRVILVDADLNVRGYYRGDESESMVGLERDIGLLTEAR